MGMFDQQCKLNSINIMCLLKGLNRQTENDFMFL